MTEVTTGSIAGLVLAAGSGRRMGGPKALLRLAADAPTLAELAVDRLYAAGLGTVVVVTGAAGGRVAELAVHTGAMTVACPDWDEGMGASLRTGLSYVAELDAPPAAVLVTLVDLPDVTEAVHQRVLGTAAAAAAAGPATPGGAVATALVRAAYAGVPGHPVLLGRDHWAGIREVATGDRGARDYLAKHEVVLVECGDLASGRDADRPGDLV